MDFPRLFAYTTGLLFIALAIILFTSKFIVYANNPSFIGSLTHFGFGFLYLNLVFAISRRYIRKVMRDTVIQYYFAVVAAIPPVVWINVFDTGLSETVSLQISVIIGTFMGGWLGHRSGVKLRDQFIQKQQEAAAQEQDLPEVLQRPHDNLNKN